MAKKGGLGRGLEAILGDVELAYKAEISEGNSDIIKDIDLELITENPYQPRKNFDETALRELSESIKRHGLIQPIIVIEKDGGIAIDEGTFVLQPTENQQKHLKKYVGKNVFFGIRPEDVTYRPASTDGETIDGTVSVVEPLGSETHVFVSTAKNQVTGKIDPTVIIKVGEKVSLAPNMNKAKFFDLQTELAIR